MKNLKFDGPSFVNPSHTSYSLINNLGYQTPQMVLNSNKDTKSQSSFDIIDKKREIIIGSTAGKGPRGKVFFYI
jgi:hypothetical protein